MAKQVWSDALLDEMRMNSDPEADKAAAALFINKNHGEIFKQLGEMASNDASIPESFPVDLSNYFVHQKLDFTKNEEKLLDTAAEVFKKYGLHVCAMLYFKSLPTGYMCPDPSHVLATTKLLITNTTRRVLETAQYVFDVSRKNWLDPQGRGLNSIKKVRLMHASMRLMIEYNPDIDWDKEKLGIPINQEDMVFTLQLFSLAVFEGLHYMGIRLSHREKEAYFFKWKIIGRLMGIDERLEANSLSDAWNLQNKILSRSVKMPSPDGPILAKELIDMVHDYMPPKITHASFEKTTMYFIGNSMSSKTLGFVTPSWSDKLIDFVIKILMNLRIWHKIYPPEILKGKRPHFFQKLIKSVMYSRLGLDYNWKQPYQKDPMETISKYLLKTLTQNAYLSDARKFTIDPELLEHWGIDEFEFDEGESVVSEDFV